LFIFLELAFRENAKVKPKQLTQSLKTLIVHSASLGKSVTEIAKDIDFNKSTVSRCLKKHSEGCCLLRKVGSGEKKKLTDLEQRDVILKAKRDPHITRHQIRQEIGREDVCLNTIANVIHSSSKLGSYWQTNKPFISKINQKKRVTWCKEHENCDQAYWRSVLWSDESPFVLRYNGRKRVWRLHNQRYDKFALKGSFKQDIKIMVWGCFGDGKVGRLYHVEGIMDAKVYMRILDNEMRPSYQSIFGKKRWIFQQDNDPKHKAKRTMEYLEDQNIPLMSWPAQSPDLNPIENLWSILDERCKERKSKNAGELYQILLETWNALDRDLLLNLADSMPHRIKAVLAAKGLPTHY
jgi:transposase